MRNTAAFLSTEWICVRIAKLFADRVAGRPEMARHGFIDDGNLRRIGGVPAREGPALEQPDTDGIEVSGTDAIAADRFGRLRRTAGDGDLKIGIPPL